MDRHQEELQALRQNGNYRQLPSEETLDLLDLCSNDYLGINANSQLRADFLNLHQDSLAFSATSSRLLSKSLKEHIHFEKLIATTYGKESALLFNSGYHANLGFMSSIPGKKDLIIADKLIHACVIDGALLSKAKLMRYRHLDYQHLEQLLSKYRDDFDQVFIVSESIFSMDGDLADIARLVEIKKRHRCYLYIDEAHGIGVEGRRGLGLVEATDCIEEVDFIVSPMGKAMASVGAFLTCPKVFKEYLINHARAFIFSTALPPINTAWSCFVFEKMQDMTLERQHLKHLSRQFANLLDTENQSNIIPLIIGSNEDAIAKSAALKQAGFHVLPIRYPTVPKHTARLRFSICANMKIEALQPLQDLLI